MKTSLFIAFITLISMSLHASSKKGGQHFEDYLITGFSRPCCSFGLDTLGQKMGISGVISKDEIGEHSFARREKKDKVGMIYTCNAGFIDVSHLRDNADWSAHIYTKLPAWLGMGTEVKARNEGGFKTRTVYFPKLDPAKLSELSEEDKVRIAVSIGYSMALLHEISTAFPIAVSVPSAFFVYERVSAFSLEDAFSNLQGNWLGVRAAQKALPYNLAMTAILNETLEGYGAQSRENTLKAYALVRNDWWTKAFFNTMKNVLKRDFTYEGLVGPRTIDTAEFCPMPNTATLEIPDRLSNGSSVHDYYEIRGVMTKRLNRHLNKWGVSLDMIMTQRDYPLVIDTIKSKYVERLGANILN